MLLEAPPPPPPFESTTVHNLNALRSFIHLWRSTEEWEWEDNLKWEIQKKKKHLSVYFNRYSHA